MNDAEETMQSLIGALPYLKRYDDQIVVVKYGGHAMGEEETALRFGRDIALLEQVGVNPVVVHGGGPQINAMLGRLGVKWQVAGGRLVLPVRQALRVRKDLGGAIPKMEDGIWPAIPSDLLSVALVLATQTRGGVLFFEKVFESRRYFVDRLLEMGATLVQCDPHRVVVSGPAKLRAQLITSPDIRAGMALIIARYTSALSSANAPPTTTTVPRSA